MSENKRGTLGNCESHAPGHGIAHEKSSDFSPCQNWAPLPSSEGTVKSPDRCPRCGSLEKPFLSLKCASINENSHPWHHEPSVPLKSEAPTEDAPIIIGTEGNIPELVRIAKLLLSTKSTFKRWQQAYSPLHSAFEFGKRALKSETAKSEDQQADELARRIVEDLTPEQIHNIASKIHEIANRSKSETVEERE